MKTPMAPRTPIADQAKGKWLSILPACGVSKDFLINRHGPCPVCAGKDRFRFDDKGRGMWFCNQCGSGDGVALLMKVHGWDFKTTAREIEKHVGLAPVIAIRQGPDPAVIRKEMNDIWASGKPLMLLQATQRWWMGRVGDVPTCFDLRGIYSLSCPGQGSFPGMVALVRDLAGKPVNLHRTFLTNDGQKADIPEPRRVMPMPMPKGCAVRLWAPTDVLGIAEGIETAVAATELFGTPCWAALNAQNLQEWVPPEGVRVVIYGDNDRSLTGHAAAYTLGRKLKAKGVEVSVEIPEMPGTDWNDVLLERMRAPRREIA